MKREINFRAWAIVEKKMCQVTTLTDKGAFLVGIEPEADQILMDGKYIVRGCDNGRFLTNDEFELMQFTGLLDKNGKKIFEFDRVFDPFSPKDERELFTVKWDIEMARFILAGEGEAEWDETDWQVYDNIYEQK